MKQHTYIAIDLKSFYASVECRERGLDPLDTNLVVADESRTDKTICLAVTPSLKSYGSAEHGKAVCQLVDELCAGGETKHGGDLIRKVEGEDIRKVQKNEFLHIGFVHSSTPRSLVLTLTFSLCCALLWAFS